MPTSAPTRLRRLAVLPALALVASLLPLTAEPAVAAPTSPGGPPVTAATTSATARPSLGDAPSTSAATALITTPTKDALVSGNPLTVKVRVAGGTSGFKASLDR